MSTTTILSAINFNATAAAEKNRTTGAAVALFKKGGKEVNTSEKALGRDCLKGITAEQYETYCKAVRAVYLDADLLARYAADADSVQKIKTFYFNDLASLTTSIMGDTFKVNDVFATFTVEQFIEQSVGKVRAFTLPPQATATTRKQSLRLNLSSGLKHGLVPTQAVLLCSLWQSVTAVQVSASCPLRLCALLRVLRMQKRCCLVPRRSWIPSRARRIPTQRLWKRK